MLESNLEPQNLNCQENLVNNGINQDNTQVELKTFNSNNDTLTLNFQKFDKSLLVGVSILLIFCGGYASLESESLIYLCIILFLLIL